MSKIKVNEMDSQVSTEIMFTAVDAPAFKRLETQGIMSIFNKAICSLAIIQQLLPKPQLQSKKSVWYSQGLSELQPFTIPEDQPSNKTLLMKHVHDYSYFLQRILNDSAIEIFFHGTCHYLQYVVCCNKLNTYNEIHIKNENENIKKTIEHLKEKIMAVQKNFKEVNLYLSDIAGQCFERAMVNTWAQSECILSHTKTKEGARSDQIHYKMKKKKYAVQKTIQEEHLKLENDCRISNEIEKQLILTTSCLKDDLQKWTNKYNEDMEVLDVTILQMNNKIESQREKYQILLEMYNNRKIKVEEMHAEIDEEERKMELRLKQIRAAIKIQRWWKKIFLRIKMFQTRLPKTKKKNKKRKI